MLKAYLSLVLAIGIFITQLTTSALAGFGGTSGTGGASSQNPAQLQDLETIFQRFVGFLLPAAGILFFMMFVMGGFKYLTSAGDLNAVASAHKTLTYAIGGLIVVALAYLVLLVIHELTGAPILNFVIYQP